MKRDACTNACWNGYSILKGEQKIGKGFDGKFIIVLYSFYLSIYQYLWYFVLIYVFIHFIIYYLLCTTYFTYI